MVMLQVKPEILFMALFASYVLDIETLTFFPAH